MNRFSKTTHIFALLLLVLMVFELLACSNSMDFEPPVTTPQATEANATLQPFPSDKTSWLEVVYFHRTNRCNGCIYAEDATKYTIQTHFGTELSSGELVFKVYDLQDEANAESVKKYEAHSSSLFINEINNGTDQIEEITDIWTKLGRDEAFIEVVKTAIEEHLENI
ncbi:MAG: hypothetical protein HQ553_14880 [Chloroflexi bacterium]|nr:hypothetical protein [Chloroflexota bacterium]